MQIWDSLATAFLHHRECNFRTGTKDTEFKSSHFNLAYFISSLVVSSSFFYYTSLVINLFEFAMSSQTVPYHKQKVLHSITNLPVTSKWLHKINILLQHTFLPTKWKSYDFWDQGYVFNFFTQYYKNVFKLFKDNFKSFHCLWKIEDVNRIVGNLYCSAKLREI